MMVLFMHFLEVFVSTEVLVELIQYKKETLLLFDLRNVNSKIVNVRPEIYGGLNVVRITDELGRSATFYLNKYGLRTRPKKITIINNIVTLFF